MLGLLSLLLVPNGVAPAPHFALFAALVGSISATTPAVALALPSPSASTALEPTSAAPQRGLFEDACAMVLPWRDVLAVCSNTTLRQKWALERLACVFTQHHRPFDVDLLNMSDTSPLMQVYLLMCAQTNTRCTALASAYDDLQSTLASVEKDSAAKIAYAEASCDKRIKDGKVVAAIESEDTLENTLSHIRSEHVLCALVPGEPVNFFSAIFFLDLILFSPPDSLNPAAVVFEIINLGAAYNFNVTLA